MSWEILPKWINLVKTIPTIKVILTFIHSFFFICFLSDVTLFAPFVDESKYIHIYESMVLPNMTCSITPWRMEVPNKAKPTQTLNFATKEGNLTWWQCTSTLIHSFQRSNFYIASMNFIWSILHNQSHYISLLPKIYLLTLFFLNLSLGLILFGSKYDIQPVVTKKWGQVMNETKAESQPWKKCSCHFVCLRTLWPPLLLIISQQQSIDWNCIDD